MPQFVIASASESLPAPVGVPAWRIVAGNLAAGAVAGCAVEAGAALLTRIAVRVSIRTQAACHSSLLMSERRTGYTDKLQTSRGVSRP